MVPSHRSRRRTRAALLGHLFTSGDCFRGELVERLDLTEASISRIVAELRSEALTMGLASEVVADDEVEPRGLAVATQLAAGPRQALQLIKEAVIEGMNLPLDHGLQYERKCLALLFATRDKHEGMRARLEKRQAAFGP